MKDILFAELMSFLRFIPSVEKVLPANSDRYVITCYQNEENYRTYVSNVCTCIYLYISYV